MANEKPFGFVYRITNLLNGKCYIGQTTQSLAGRWGHHKSYSRNSTACHTRLVVALRTDGESNFKADIISYGSSREELKAIEKIWIQALNTTDANYGYNLASGGENLHAEESKDKIRKAHIGRSFSTEHRAKLSAIAKSRTFSEETRRKMGEARKGHVVTEETRAKISAAHRGRVTSEEHRRNSGLAKSGIILSEEHRNKIGNALRGRIRGPYAKREAANA